MSTFDKNFEMVLPAALFGQDPSIGYHPFAGLTAGSLLWLVTSIPEEVEQDESAPRVYMFIRLEDVLELLSSRGYDCHKLNLIDSTCIGTGKPAFYENIRSLWSFDVTSIGDQHECGIKINSGDGNSYVTRARYHSHGKAIPKVVWHRPAF